MDVPDSTKFLRVTISTILKKALSVTVLCELLIPRIFKLCPFLCGRDQNSAHNSVLLDNAFSVLWQHSKVFPKGFYPYACL